MVAPCSGVEAEVADRVEALMPAEGIERGERNNGEHTQHLGDLGREGLPPPSPLNIDRRAG